MDKNQLIVLQSDINAQLNIVKIIAETVEQRAIGLEAEDMVRLESVAYQVHNLLSAHATGCK